MVSDSARKLVIGYSIWPTGHHRLAWRLPEAFNRGTVDPVFLGDSIRTAERGLFDYFFIGNSVKSDPSSARASGNEVFKIEGYTLAGYAAAITSRIGVVVTINSTYSDPYNTARAIVSLDHLTNGRAGLNIVTGITGSAASSNFSKDSHAATDDKYDWADELVEVVHALSDSWESDWLVDDRERGIFLDPEKGHYIDHAGKHFSVRGPLNLPRPPQGHIPIIHAGTSERSFEFGAKYADIRFSPYRGPDWNRRYYTDVKDRLPAHGREKDDQFILPGFTFFVGGTSREAHAKYRQVQAFAEGEYIPKVVSDFVGLDLSRVSESEKVLDVLDIDALRTEAAAAPLDAQGNTQAVANFSGNKLWAVELALEAYGDEDVTFRDLYHYIANFPGNQAPVVGSGPEIADWIEERFHDRQIDGVKVFPPYSKYPLDAFVDEVVPQLQRKGIFRTSYETTTLRGHLGLDTPENPYARR